MDIMEDDDEDLDPIVVLTAIEVVNDDSNQDDLVALRQAEARYNASVAAAGRNRAAGTPPDHVSVEEWQYDELIVESRRLRIERDRFERKARALEKCVRKLGVDTKHREALETSVAALKIIAAHGRVWGGGVQELCEEVKTFHTRLQAQERIAYETNVLSTHTLGVLTPSKLAVALWSPNLASFGLILREPNRQRPYEVNLGLVYPHEAGLQYTLAVAPGAVTMLNASTLCPSLRKVFNGKNLRALYLSEMQRLKTHPDTLATIETSDAVSEEEETFRREVWRQTERAIGSQDAKLHEGEFGTRRFGELLELHSVFTRSHASVPQPGRKRAAPVVPVTVATAAAAASSAKSPRASPAGVAYMSVSV